MKIIFIGYMGCGKTTIGKLLASKLEIPFKDLDDEIETYERLSIPLIFSKKGEVYFRKIERKILNTVLVSNDNLVLATGGGTPSYGDTMDLLISDKGIITIYLKSSLSTLTNRIFKEKLQRPLISHIQTKEDLTDFIRKHLFERMHIYNKASLIIDTEGKSNLEIVEEIILELF